MRVALDLGRLWLFDVWHTYVYSVWTYWASRSILYFLVSGEDQTLYDLSGFNIIYEHEDDASGPDYPADD